MTITEWIEALESGRFKQIQHRLKAPDGYCCLGVACELAGVDWVGGIWASYKGDSSTKKLPTPLQDELGLTKDQMSELIAMNDVEKMSFRQIAAKLREWFPQ